MITRTEPEALEQLVGSACRVVGARRDVRTISVVLGRRLAYPELARAREQAAACGVHLTMDGTGVVKVRRYGAGASGFGRAPHRPVGDVAKARRHGS